jgi:hypothetical protein
VFSPRSARGPRTKCACYETPHLPTTDNMSSRRPRGMTRRSSSTYEWCQTTPNGGRPEHMTIYACVQNVRAHPMHENPTTAMMNITCVVWSKVFLLSNVYTRIYRCIHAHNYIYIYIYISIYIYLYTDLYNCTRNSREIYVQISPFDCWHCSWFTGMRTGGPKPVPHATTFFLCFITVARCPDNTL